MLFRNCQQWFKVHQHLKQPLAMQQNSGSQPLINDERKSRHIVVINYEQEKVLAQNIGSVKLKAVRMCFACPSGILKPSELQGSGKSVRPDLYMLCFR